MQEESAAESGGAKNEAREWTKDYSTFFWHQAQPFDAKFEVEKTLRLLLRREQGTDAQDQRLLTYTGSSRPPTIGCRARLRFEAAFPEGNWYSLSVQAWIPCSWEDEAGFIEHADRAFAYWTRNLQTDPRLGPAGSASQDLYEERVELTLAKEREEMETLRDDTPPILAVRREIADGLRNGMSFRTVHHEGGTTFRFDGKNFVRSTYGVEESKRMFATEEEMFKDLREFYDWWSRRDTFPHRPPELDVWRFILGQMT